MKNNPATMHNTIDLWRIVSFGVVIGLAFGIYTARMLFLQIIEYDIYSQQARENWLSEINLPAQRGVIYDRNDVVLARNIPSYNVVVTAGLLPDDEGAVEEIVNNISKLTDMPVNLNAISDEFPFVPCRSEHGVKQVFEYGLVSEPFNPVRVACNVSREVALTIQEKSASWPGITIETMPVRDYPTGYLTANLIGFLGPIPADQEDDYSGKRFVSNRDKVGYSGLELYFQEELGGVNGLRTVSRDSAGELIQDVQPPIAPVPGTNLRLTIDTRLQQAAMTILEREIEGWNAWLGEQRYTSGVTIAINPKTGEVLAMAIYPSYENNRMAREIPAYYYNQLLADSREPLRNHAVYAELPAGSVFKLVTATGALNEGVLTPETIVQTPGVLFVSEKSFYTNVPVAPREFVDWIYKNGLNPAGFGQLNMVGCIANSSNVCFYKVGGGYLDEIDPGLGICRLGTYARALGYGTLPAIELPETADGLIPDPDWKRINQSESWTIGDTYIMSVGQGYALATPLQVLLSAATVANDGKLMEPTLLRDMIDGDGNIIQAFSPNMRWDLTVDPKIEVYSENSTRGCRPTGETKTIEPWVFDLVQQGMRQAVLTGTLKDIFYDIPGLNAAGKTGTAEYCDKYARAQGRCEPGNWPSHAWTVAYAPYEDPEIAVVAFVYNGSEGSSVAGPIVKFMLEAYFELKQVDAAK